VPDVEARETFSERVKMFAKMPDDQVVEEIIDMLKVSVTLTNEVKDKIAKHYAATLFILPDKGRARIRGLFREALFTFPGEVQKQYLALTQIHILEEIVQIKKSMKEKFKKFAEEAPAPETRSIFQELVNEEEEHLNHKINERF
jgi:demethoxyubiquinone hydroxylase (CLK1/Coq7/Cat5 family)